MENEKKKICFHAWMWLGNPKKMYHLGCITALGSRNVLVGVMLPITFQAALCMDCVEGTGHQYIPMSRALIDIRRSLSFRSHIWKSAWAFGHGWGSNVVCAPRGTIPKQSNRGGTAHHFNIRMLLSPVAIGYCLGIMGAGWAPGGPPSQDCGGLGPDGMYGAVCSGH